ncbi:hypothetical protein B0H14DRAFT_3469610 [Mycena olivaceomarginata]|nr:hypothetical protein B0H14DRAFT_3469610 [Mycena olivaceomarginata]
MARLRVLHGMPIRDLWAPPQLGRLPTRVAIYFPTPSAAAYALSGSLFNPTAILLIVAFTYPFLLHSLVTPLRVIISSTTIPSPL